MWWFSVALLVACLTGMSHALPWLALAVVAFISIFCSSRRRCLLPLWLLCGGALWGALGLQKGLESWLPTAVDGQVLELEGRVVGLPESVPLGASWRWNLVLDQVRVVEGDAWPGSHRIRLSAWAVDGPFSAGDQLRFRARLNRPRGLVNQGSMDRARLDLARGIQARGSLRELLDHQPGPNRLDRYRSRLSSQVTERLAHSPVAAALLPALLTGDRRNITGEHWSLLQRTGTAHLMAISGLHITLVTGVVWWLFRWLLALPVFRLGGLSAQQLAVVPALAAAVGYAALAGFALPTVRALLMNAVALLALLWRIRPALTDALGLALLLVLLLEPLAVLDNSFWLSFSAVAVLLLLAAGGGGGVWRMQWVLSLGLGALAGWLFLHWGLFSPLANLLMVPLFSLLIVPLVLVGGLLPGADPLLQASAWLLQQGWQLLGWLNSFNLQLPPPGGWPAVLLVLAAILLLSLPGLPLPRWPVPFLLLPWLWPALDRPAPGDFDVIVFDVGQGQAVAIRTARHLVLYDLGPGWPGGDMGGRVIEPWLRRQRAMPSLTFVSHGDIDHAGGLASLAGYIPPGTLLSGEVARVAESRSCRRGQRWELDGVRLEVLWPLSGLPLRQANNASCVLLITGRAATAMLTGDITRPVEFWLSQHDAQPLDLLQVAHHGSSTSSSYTFLRAFQPRLAFASAGHNNRFGQPSQQTRRRFTDFDIPLLVTAETGMIVFPMRDQDNAAPIRWRERHRRPWRPDD